MDKKNFCLRDFGGDLSQRWFVQYKEDERWKKTYISAKLTTQEARNKKAKSIIAALQGKEVPKPLAYIEALRHVVEQRLLGARKKTKQSYLSKFNTFEKYCYQNSLAVFDAGEAEKFVFYLKAKRKLHNGTINDYVVLMKSLFAAIELKANPFEKIVPMKSSQTPARYFSATQRTQLKEVIAEDDPNLWAFVQFMYYTFIRPGELRLLKVGDVDFELGKIRVPANISKNGKLQFVAMPTAFCGVVKEYLWGKLEDAYIFPSTKRGNKPQGMHYMAVKHQTILKKLGYNTAEYKLYSWKHTGAVACVKGGVGMKDLQIQLRHHSLDQVNAYLRQMGVDDLQDLVNKFPSL